jgi:hypothetical protein
MSTSTAAIPHAPFCLPRPGEDAPRQETYRLPRYSDEGHAIGSVRVDRCVECGNATYDGVQRD